MTVALVIAPHPDDETLGCGGTLLKLVASGIRVHWMIASKIGGGQFAHITEAERADEIAQVARAYRFAETHELGLQTMRLETVAVGDFVGMIAQVVKRISPTIVFLPYGGDAHSDHAATFRASVAAVKKFRAPSVNRVLVYETLSETDNGLDPDANGFRPNSYCDIGDALDEKIRIMKMYKGELAEPPFPRSVEAIRALATMRGGAAYCRAAEAFMVLRETW